MDMLGFLLRWQLGSLKAFGRSPEGWLALQSSYDLAQIRNTEKIDVKPLFEAPINA